LVALRVIRHGGFELNNGLVQLICHYQGTTQLAARVSGIWFEPYGFNELLTRFVVSPQVLEHHPKAVMGRSTPRPRSHRSLKLAKGILRFALSIQNSP